MTVSIDPTDMQLQEEVAARIGWDPRFTPGEVGVEVDQGIVTLRGSVSSYQKVVAAGEIAASTNGAKAVANDLIIQPPEQGELDDTATARAVRWALEWDAEVPDDRVRCVVRDGTVTLSGGVEHEYQHSAAVSAASRVPSVRRVIDAIRVERQWRSDEKTCTDLRASLALLPGAEMVGFRCRSGLVVLRGLVRTPEARLAVERVAWSVPGVRHVLNSIATVSG